MAEIFSFPGKNINGKNQNVTICSGPVIISKDKKILLHISASTGKYQFIGGRLDTNLSLQENALKRASEVIGESKIIFLENEPICIHGGIERNEEKEYLVLFHFLAKLENEENIGSAEWKTLEEIQILEKENKVSSENILIASKYFLGKD